VVMQREVGGGHRDAIPSPLPGRVACTKCPVAYATG
jgi:hypothetical protein